MSDAQIKNFILFPFAKKIIIYLVILARYPSMPENLISIHVAQVRANK